jgi:hypothetical protein
MRKMTTIRVKEEILSKAQELGLNVSRVCENALEIYIRVLTTANNSMLNGGSPEFLNESSFAKEISTRSQASQAQHLGSSSPNR